LLEELLDKKGRYASMWNKQIRAEQKMKKIEDEFENDKSGYATPNIVVSDSSEPVDGEGSNTLTKPLLGTGGAPGVSPAPGPEESVKEP